MENDCDIWNINVNNITEKVKASMPMNRTTYLLDMNSKTKDILEYYVYSIAKNMFKQMNIDDTENYFVEFWWKNNAVHAFHVDCDEELKKTENKYVHPLLSCVNYLNDNVNPIIITNINVEQYTYKEFDNGSIILVFPQKNTLLTFYGGNYHGVVNIKNKDANDNEDRYVIAINIWKERPHNVEYYISESSLGVDEDDIAELSNITLKMRNRTIKRVSVNDTILDYIFFDNILYKNILSIPHIGTILNNDNNNFDSSKVYIMQQKDKKDEIIIIDNNVKNFEKIKADIDNINNENYDNIQFKNRFLQRFTIKQFLSSDICNWIIHETNAYANIHGWTKLRHENYPTTDLPVKVLSNIHGFIKNVVEQSIFFNIIKNYRLPKRDLLSISDIFLVKYSMDSQTHLELHQDGEFFSFNILLNKPSDFEGGGTYFEDGLIHTLEQGELLLHCGKLRHAGLPITKGERYLLVGFINLKF